MYERATLSNGVRILTSRMPSVRSVSVAVLFGVGSRYEDEAIAGVSHLIEHMVFKGTERFPSARVISEAIEGVGGVLDAGTDKQTTAYSAKIASRHFDLALRVLADMVLHPRFEAQELEKERRVIVEEINMYRDSPQEWVGVLADETLWPDLPLGREIAGTRATVEAISRGAMVDFWRRHYRPGNVVLSVVGDVDHATVVDLSNELFSTWEAAPVPEWTPCMPPSGVARVRLERRATEQTNLCFIMPGLSFEDDDYYVLAVLNAVLGDGMSSRLFLEVREQQGLAYDVSSAPMSYHDTGSFLIYAGVEPKRAAPAMGAILAELARMREEPVSNDELQRAKEYNKGRMALRLEDTHSVASWLGGQELLRRKIESLDEVMAHFDAVAAEDVQRVAARLFRGEWLRLAVIGPHKDAGEFEALLAV
jgi:predicted Zn-dependent peptidase